MSTSEAQDPVERPDRDWGGGAHNVMGFQVLLKCLFSLSAFVQGFFLLLNQSTTNGLPAVFFFAKCFLVLIFTLSFQPSELEQLRNIFSLPFIESDFLVGGQVSDPIGKKTSGAQMFFQLI